MNIKTPIDLRQLFKNMSDCYADTWKPSDKKGLLYEGEIIQAMTEDRFIEAIESYHSQFEDIIKERIVELKKIDSDYCVKRWDMSLDINERNLYRGLSNEVTFARQELERILKSFSLNNQPNAKQ